MNEERVEIAVRKLPRLRIGIWSGRSFVVGVAAGNGNTKREQNESFEHDGLCRRLCASCQIFMKNEATLTAKSRRMADRSTAITATNAPPILLHQR